MEETGEDERREGKGCRKDGVRVVTEACIWVTRGQKEGCGSKIRVKERKG